MLNHYVDRIVTVYYSDGTRLLSTTGPITQFDGKHGLFKMKVNEREILFPLHSVTKIEVVEFQEESEIEPEVVESYEHRGHDFW